MVGPKMLVHMEFFCWVLFIWSLGMKNQWVPPQGPWSFLYTKVNWRWWILTNIHYSVKNSNSTLLREFPILKRKRYSNCFLLFCCNIYFFNFEESLINKTFKYNKILEIDLGASLKPCIYSFCFWSIHTEKMKIIS